VASCLLDSPGQRPHAVPARVEQLDRDSPAPAACRRASPPCAPDSIRAPARRRRAPPDGFHDHLAGRGRAARPGSV
jgi:hypothetical protein